MSDARGRILSSVCSSLLRATLPGADSAPAAAPVAAAPDRDAMIASFTAALEALKGQVHRAASCAEAAATVATIAADYGATSFLGWDESTLACPGILATLASRGIRRVTYDMPSDGAARDRVMRMIAAPPLGVTGADAALADTGALVLVAGPGRGRLCSMLPPVHVALVPLERLVRDLGAFLESRPGLLDEASNVAVIAGPSRTADIEMTLTHGVHGPRHVHVVLMG